MIGTIKVCCSASNPEVKLQNWVAFKDSPSNIRLLDIPRKIGQWEITSVQVQAKYPDNSIKTTDCVKEGAVWVGTIEGSTASGSSANGYTVIANGIDEKGNEVSGYVIGKGDIKILDTNGSIVIDGEAYQMVLRDEEPETPHKGDVIQTMDGPMYYDGSEWNLFYQFTEEEMMVLNSGISRQSIQQMQKDINNKAPYAEFDEGVKYVSIDEHIDYLNKSDEWANFRLYLTDCETHKLSEATIEDFMFEFGCDDYEVVKDQYIKFNTQPFANGYESMQLRVGSSLSNPYGLVITVGFNYKLKSDGTYEDAPYSVYLSLDGWVTQSRIGITDRHEDWGSDISFYAPQSKAKYGIVDSINKIAYDKATVDNKINEFAAHYLTDRIGSYQVFASKARLDDAMNYHNIKTNPRFWYGTEAHTPDKNDYCIVLTDETHGNKTARYSFAGEFGKGGEWRYQYTINDIAFTTPQMNAINSGITAAMVKDSWVPRHDSTGETELYWQGMALRIGDDDRDYIEFNVDSYQSDRKLGGANYFCTMLRSGSIVYIPNHGLAVNNVVLVSEDTVLDAIKTTGYNETVFEAQTEDGSNISFKVLTK